MVYRLQWGVLLLLMMSMALSPIGTRNFLIVLLLFSLVRCFQERVPGKIARGLVVAWLIYLCVPALEIWLGIGVASKWGRFFECYVFPTVFLFVPLFCLKKQTQTYWLIGALLASFSLAALSVCWKGLLFHDLRAAALSQMPQIFGALAVMLLPLALVFGIDERTLPRWRMVNLIVFSLGGVALLFNGSRGAWTGVAFSLLLYAGLLFMKNRKRFFFLFFLAVGIIGLSIAIPGVEQRIASIGDMNNLNNWHRFLIWRSAQQMIADYPVFGVGYACFPDVYNLHYISPLSIERAHSHAHNLLLNIFVEQGLIGFSAFVLTIGCLYRKVWETGKSFVDKRIHIAVLLGGGGFFVLGFTDFLWDQVIVIRVFWLLMGIALWTKNNEILSGETND